jgi:hypothetical protein
MGSKKEKGNVRKESDGWKNFSPTCRAGKCEEGK